MATPNEAIQTLVREFDAQNVPVVVIAERLGISRERVEEVLRELPTVDDDGTTLKEEPVPALSPEAAARANRLAARLRVLPSPEDVLTPARRPEGAVAHLSLPIAAAALIAVVDALELAYGPGIRVDAADGGVWVLGRAS